MERNVRRLPPQAASDEAEAALASKPRWILVEPEPGQIRCILSAADLSAFLEERGPAEDADGEVAHDNGARPTTVDLLKIPAMRKDVGNIDVRATIGEAQDHLQKTGGGSALRPAHLGAHDRPHSRRGDHGADRQLPGAGSLSTGYCG